MYNNSQNYGIFIWDHLYGNLQQNGPKIIFHNFGSYYRLSPRLTKEGVKSQGGNECISFASGWESTGICYSRLQKQAGA